MFVKLKNISINVRRSEITIATSITDNHIFPGNGSKNTVQERPLSLTVLINTSALEWVIVGNISNALALGTI